MEYNIEDAVSVKEFFKQNNVKGDNRTFFIKTCTAYKGTDDEHQFQALALRNGDKTEDGKDSYTFFGLSKKLVAEGETLNKAFLAKHSKEMMLLENEEGVGTIFLPGTVEVWDFD